MPFEGKVSIDIRDSLEIRASFAQPKAPPGAPNVLHIVLVDIGDVALGRVMQP